jgi:hypothetical protein
MGAFRPIHAKSFLYRFGKSNPERAMISNSVVFIARCCVGVLGLNAEFAFADAPNDPSFGFSAPYPFPLGTGDAAAVAIARDSTGHLVTATTISPSSSNPNKKARSIHGSARTA